MTTDNDEKAPSQLQEVRPPRVSTPSSDPFAATVTGEDKTDSLKTPPLTGKLVGATLDGRYFIEEELGHGGVGTIYLARDRKLHDKSVVVKLLLEASLTDPWVIKKFQQEKEALARVDHPGVVGVVDTGELPDGKPYIVMQFVDGNSLREAIKEKPEGLNLVRTASIIQQTGAALNAVHESKIYHRDLKPENIMLQKLVRGDEQVKIVDFGIAKVKESVIAPSTVTGAGTAGTIVYMSPEQLRGDKISAASDIYSLGVIAYEMVTGRRPFYPDTIAHLSDMQREGIRVKPSDLRPRLPQDAEAIILKALDFNPLNRQQNAADFGEALARALMNDEGALKQPAHEVPRSEPAIANDEQLYEAALPGVKTFVKPLGAKARVSVDKSAGKALSLSRKSAGEGFSLNAAWVKLTAGLLFLVVIAVVLYGAISRNRVATSTSPPNSNAAAPVVRSVSYWLMVQKKRKDGTYDEPFQSLGEGSFTNGDRFRFNLTCSQAGYLYLFNEGYSANTDYSLTLIYPTPKTIASALDQKKRAEFVKVKLEEVLPLRQTEANVITQSGWNDFAGQLPTEKLWIVWSDAPIQDFDAPISSAFRSAKGAITEPKLISKVREFLISHAEPKPEVTRDTAQQQIILKNNSDLLVKLVEIEHH